MPNLLTFESDEVAEQRNCICDKCGKAGGTLVSFSTAPHPDALPPYPMFHADCLREIAAAADNADLRDDGWREKHITA